ncbi:MAG TPA: CheR family methyltransferase, partial [Candidatus Methylacidiphilales bacterium]
MSGLDDRPEYPGADPLADPGASAPALPPPIPFPQGIEAVPTPADLAFAESVQLLFARVFHQYGFDYRHYSAGYLHRRVARAMNEFRMATIGELESLVLSDPAAMGRFVDLLTVYTTTMFRDPEFFQVVRSEVVPWLRTYPFFRIWVAGCSTGEEAYSLAILFKEEGIYDRCRIYATDFNESVLARAKAGVFPLPLMEDYAKNYREAGGREDFST